jgi:hypothetical protein
MQAEWTIRWDVVRWTWKGGAAWKIVVTPTLAGDSPVLPPQEPVADACSVFLSERDAAEVMAAAENPLAPNDTALHAAKRFLQSHG